MTPANDIGSPNTLARPARSPIRRKRAANPSCKAASRSSRTKKTRRKSHPQGVWARLRRKLEESAEWGLCDARQVRASLERPASRAACGVQRPSKGDRRRGLDPRAACSFAHPPTWPAENGVAELAHPAYIDAQVGCAPAVHQAGREVLALGGQRHRLVVDQIAQLQKQNGVDACAR
jgi:hypothetical protein